MQLKQLSLTNFRNYKNAVLEFFNGIHIIYGENGAGKTNILESIFYLALTRSFRTNVDRHLIQRNENMFRIQGEFNTIHTNTLNCSIAYSLSEGKRLNINGQKAEKFSDYIGEVPVVLLCPSDLDLSQGSPLGRRRFIDILLSQSSKLYLHHLIQYRRSLKHRNQLLQSPSTDLQLLAAWEENLIKTGAEIIKKRMETVSELSEMVKHFYQELSQKEDKVKIVYQSNVLNTPAEDIESAYGQQFEKQRPSEMENGTTQVGPHRDDLLFLISGKPMRIYASQGEHKTFIIALKLAEYQYLQKQRQQPPILLFDDIFAELDAHRIQRMLNQLGEMGQVFVTTTSRNFFDKVQNFQSPTYYYFVNKGTVSYQNA